MSSNLYQVRSNGDLEFRGERPGSGWHGHGFFPRWLWMLVNGGVCRKRIWKCRWLLPGKGKRGRTCHSRPPDELPRLGFCTLVIVLKVWSWLERVESWQQAQEVHDQLHQCGDHRSVQRWLRRLLPHAMAIQQAIRLAVIERCEPRPVEQLFPSGLSPPAHLSRRPWRDPSGTHKLWRALALLLGGAIELSVPTTVLLAEARGRCGTPESSQN